MLVRPMLSLSCCWDDWNCRRAKLVSGGLLIATPVTHHSLVLPTPQSPFLSPKLNTFRAVLASSRSCRPHPAVRHRRRKRFLTELLDVLMWMRPLPLVPSKVSKPCARPFPVHAHHWDSGSLQELNHVTSADLASYSAVGPDQQVMGQAPPGSVLNTPARRDWTRAHPLR